MHPLVPPSAVLFLAPEKSIQNANHSSSPEVLCQKRTETSRSPITPHFLPCKRVSWTGLHLRGSCTPDLLCNLSLWLRLFQFRVSSAALACLVCSKSNAADSETSLKPVLHACFPDKVQAFRCKLCYVCFARSSSAEAWCAVLWYRSA